MGDFSNPFSPIDKSSRQKLNREMLELTEVINQMDIAVIYKTFRPNTKGYTLLSAPHGKFSKTDHKASLNRYKIPLGVYPKDAPSYYRGTCSGMFIAVLLIITRNWKQPKSPSLENG